MEKLTLINSRGSPYLLDVLIFLEYKVCLATCRSPPNQTLDEMEDLIAMSNEIGESLGRTYEVPDCLSAFYS